MFNIAIHNFRSFQNQNFNFSKINILIGENSGGKSSLLKFLLALKQTLESPLESNLKLSGDYTDLGNFEEAVYYRKDRRKIKVAFGADEKYFDYFMQFIEVIEKEATKKQLNSIKKLIKAYQYSSTKISFEFSHKLDDHTSIKTCIENDKIGTLNIIHKKKNDVNNRLIFSDLEYNFNGEQGVIENLNCYKEGFLSLFDTDLKDLCIKKFRDKYEYFYYTIIYLLVFQNYVDSNISKIRFVNPIGTSPRRFYFQEDKKSTYKLIDIEKLLNVLSDKSLSEKSFNERISLLNETIKALGIAEEIDIIKDKQLPVLALNVKTKDFWSNITDVGYGVSLQIPILFQALLSENYTNNGETILIEQPEVHLHPTLQAKFIETLLGIGPKNVYFIETHSEHIIRKLQVLVKNGTYNLRPEDVTIHYFKRDSEKFNITEHKIQSDGKLNPRFPEGFFDTSYTLIKELL